MKFAIIACRKYQDLIEELKGKGLNICVVDADNLPSKKDIMDCDLVVFQEIKNVNQVAEFIAGFRERRTVIVRGEIYRDGADVKSCPKLEKDLKNLNTFLDGMNHRFIVVAPNEDVSMRAQKVCKHLKIRKRIKTRKVA